MIFTLPKYFEVQLGKKLTYFTGQQLDPAAQVILHLISPWLKPVTLRRVLVNLTTRPCRISSGRMKLKCDGA